MVERGETAQVSSQRAVDRRARLLASLELFAGLAEPEIVKLAENCRLDEYAPEEFIVKQGESTTEMFVVERGEVRIEAEPRPGEVIVVSTLSRGDFSARCRC
jgi:CRP-like cAMP-binding protein